MVQTTPYLCHCQYIVADSQTSGSFLLLQFLYEFMEELKIWEMCWIESLKTAVGCQQNPTISAFASSVLAADIALLCSAIPWVSFFIDAFTMSSIELNLRQHNQECHRNSSRNLQTGGPNNNKNMLPRQSTWTYSEISRMKCRTTYKRNLESDKRET